MPSKPAMDDASLAALASAGDMEAFEELVVRFTPKVFGLCFSILGNRADAEDASQESFIKAYRAIATYRDQASFSTWLYRITNNACIDLVRQRNRHPMVSIDAQNEEEDGSVGFQLADDGPLQDEIVADRWSAGKVRACIDRLPRGFREVIQLRDIEGLSYKEIANLLKVREGTVKSRIARARIALLSILRKMEPLY